MPFMLRRALRKVGYRYDHFTERSTDEYRRLILGLCRDDPEVAAQLDRKQASSGTLAVAIALAEPGVEQVIVSGFSFELTQAAGEDPNIARRGTTASKHTATDALVLRHAGDAITPASSRPSRSCTRSRGCRYSPPAASPPRC